MNDKRFDDIVRGKLSDLNSDSAPNWKLFFEKKQAADQIEKDSSFDETVRDVLATHDVEYNPQHWNLLQERVNYLQRTKRRIFGFKSLELSIFALLILGFFISQNPYKLKHNDQSFANALIVDEVNTLTSELDFNNNLGSEKAVVTDKTKQNDSDFNSTSVPKKNKALNEVAESKNFISQNKAVDSDPSASPQVQFANVAIGSNRNRSFQNDNVQGDSQNELNDNLFNQNGVASAGLSQSPATPNQNNNLRTLLTVPTVINSNLNILNAPDRQLPIFVNDFGIKPTLTRNDSWLHIIASFDNNMIYTPDDLAYNTTSRKTDMYGYTLGLLYSIKRGAWEFETGLTTSTYSKPWNFVQQYGNFNGWYRYSLTNIEHKFVGVPLQTKYHFINNLEWSAFGQIGITTEFIVESEYMSENKFLGGGAILPGTNPQEIEHPEAPFTLDHNFSEGILQGGGFANNIFARANIGLGIERHITPYLATYFSGAYHFNVVNTNIGPNNDRINKFGLNVGIKVRM